MRKVQMLGAFLLMLPFCVASGRSLGADQQSIQKPTVQVKDTAQFFRWFLAMKAKIPERDQFETEQQFRKRLPAPFDDKKVLYFVLPDAIDSVGERERDAIQFSYDLSAQKLKVWSADLRGHAAEIGLVWKELGHYVGTNSFGVARDVKENEVHLYYLNILNTEKCSALEPHVVNDTVTWRRFAVTVSLPPQEAKLVSKTARIVLGVTLPGYEYAEDGLSDHHMPTIDSPRESSWYTHSIDAYLVEMLLINRANGKVLVRDKVTGSMYAQPNKPKNEATALETVPGVVGTSYPYKNFDMTVEKFEYTTGTVGEYTPEEGGRFLLVTTLLKNESPAEQFVRWDLVSPVLTSTDGEELQYVDMLLATGNRQFSQSVKGLAEVRVRMLFKIPKDVTPKTLAIKEGESRAYEFAVQ